MVKMMDSVCPSGGDANTSHGDDYDNEGDFISGENSAKDARFTELVIFHNRAQRRIAELEATVAKLEQMLSEARWGKDSAPGALGRRKMSAPMLDGPLKRMEMEQMSEWNRSLVATLEEQRNSMLKMEMDAKLQTIVLGDEVERLTTKINSLQQENDALKERVADDVLRQRQTNRVEMAFEKAKIASRVRAAGLRRLECMEAVLMETHDDLYYVQRFDAAKLPVRDVTFVLHVVTNVSSTQTPAEDFTMNIYQQLLLNTARRYKGYHVCRYRQMEIFAFHSATTALHFSRECHLGVIGVAWPSRTTDISHFSPVIDNGEVLYSGPRMHTCMYTCNPGSEVDPINGRAVYYGTEVRDAVMTTLQSAPVGEIVANDAWGKLFCKEAIIMSDVCTEVCADVQHIREKLGPGWSVVTLNKPVEGLLCSILPLALERRRGLPPYYLHPVPRFPRNIIDTEEFLQHVIPLMKGVKRVSPGCTQQQQQQPPRDSLVENISHIEQNATVEVDANSADVLELYTLRQERGKIIGLYKKLEAVSAFQEQKAMEEEDWYLASIQTIDPSDVTYVCTVDIGDDASWRRITEQTLDVNEHRHLRDCLMFSVLSSGRKSSGVHINGNRKDVFTFAFQRPEQVLCFAAHVYTVVSQKCKSLSKTDMCLARAGITMGTLKLMCNRQVATCNASSSGGGGVIWCRGTTVSLSGCLCDVANAGEFLAATDVVQAFYATQKNLASMEYNFLRHGGRLVGNDLTLVDVQSFLPKAYAYRRQRATEVGEGADELWWECPHRRIREELKLEEDFMYREEVRQLLSQQQRLMECAEAAAMATHDTAWDLSARSALRLPWPVAGKSNNTCRMAELGFLFCDAMDAIGIASSVSSELYKEIMAQYNYVVQKAVLDHDGFICQTDSKSMYIVIFKEPYSAVETAALIQRNLMTMKWSTKLLTLEATLRVQSSKTGTFLFHGVRAKTVVHVSQDYQCIRASQLEGGIECVDVVGPAIDIITALGVYAHGGEILLTNAALQSVKTTLHGSLLLRQLATQVAKIPLHVDGATLSCVPQLLRERLELFTSFVTAVNSASSKRTSGGRRPKVGEKRAAWSQDTKGAALPLPPVGMTIYGPQVGLPLGTLSSAMVQSMDNAISHIKQEMAVSVGMDAYCEGFMSLSLEMLSGFSTIIISIENGLKKRAAAAAATTSTGQTVAGAAAGAATTTTTTTTTPALGVTTRIRSAKLNTDSSTNVVSGRKTSSSTRNAGNRGLTASTKWSEAGDPYKNALQGVETVLKSVLQRCCRMLGSSVQSSKQMGHQTSPNFAAARPKKSPLPPI